MGGILEMANDRLFRFWADLDTALKTGQPQNEASHGKTPMFEELYSDPARLEQFMLAMRGISAGNFAAFAEKFDFSGYRTLCDVGGATGLLSCLVARRHPDLRCQSFDLPIVEPIAKRAYRERRDVWAGRGGFGRLLQGRAAEGGRDHDGHDPARLESGRQNEADPRRL